MFAFATARWSARQMRCEGRYGRAQLDPRPERRVQSRRQFAPRGRGDAMSNADTTLNMLTLFVRIRTDASVQALASQLQHGFTQVIWDTLHEFRVLDARITAIKSASDPNVFESLLLCTTFQMPNIEYQRV